MIKKSNLAFIAVVLIVFTLASLPAWAGTIIGSLTVKGLRSPKDVVVYISKGPVYKVDSPEARFAVDQKNLSFLPHVLVVPQGSTVHFPNNDKVGHNVFSLSRTQKFNLGNYGPGESKKIVFDKPGLVELRCDMHAEMSAYILVMKNPFFGITDKKGNFAIPDTGYLKGHGVTSVQELPAGKYTVRTWHEKLKSVKKTIVVPKSGEVVLKLKLKRGTPGSLYKR
ncbi:MAG: hypothetical protein HN580_24280 [Deltaproteobacteria bacterium]|nr:hypothetical protein [Deltaproteobacteria bacterium]MBT4088319.1 hypothetical protein [Deltaproteobacteria bacterium]MBT4269016.1 hypothetical protein [Deltaproteobacteria bacterium]MBT4639178.1 hypothetical protein [Deltaproteobacteria bacterium]MBT6501232.1 hypothetical protein [Deltaproteobacteria bacterium]